MLWWNILTGAAYNAGFFALFRFVLNCSIDGKCVTDPRCQFFNFYICCLHFLGPILCLYNVQIRLSMWLPPTQKDGSLCYVFDLEIINSERLWKSEKTVLIWQWWHFVGPQKTAVVHFCKFLKRIDMEFKSWWIIKPSLD